MLDDSTKKRILVSCIFALAIGNMMLDNVYAVLPKYIHKRNEEGQWSQDGYKFSENKETIILVMFAVAQLIFAPFTAFIKNKIGSKNTIVAGFFLTTCTTVGLALMTLIEDPDTFFYVGNALRFV